MEFFDHLKPFLGWLQTHTTISLILVFIISLFESLAFVGLLVPGSLMMTAAGILIGVEILPAWPTLLAAILGAIAGDGLSYRVGYYFKDSIHNMWPFSRYPKFLLKGEQFFAAHGGKSVFLARFSPVRPVVPVIAGMMRMNSWRFFFSNVTSAVLWAPAYIVPGILIGLAALQFAPEVATRFILLVLCVFGLFFFTAWFLKILFFRTMGWITSGMDKLWEAIKHTPKINPLYRLLQDPDRPEGHSQLNLLVGIIIAGILFLVLTVMVVTQTGVYDLNLPLNQFFRNLYIPGLQKIMLLFTYAGDKLVLGPVVAVAVLWLLWRKQWYMACHWVGIVLISYGIVAVSKYIFHSPRPTGLSVFLDGNSFPSGHTTISVALYTFYAIVLERLLAAHPRRWIYGICTIIVVLIVFTRLYLGAHWFTDVLGGILAGWIAAMLVTLSFRCKPAPRFSIKAFSAILAISFLFFLGLKFEMNFKRDKTAYVPIWPTRTIVATEWWRQNSKEVLVYRKDRLGRVHDLINVQWVDNLNHIIERLQQNEWVLLPRSAWVNAINHLANSNDRNRLTLFPPLYQGKAPAAVFVHSLEGNSGTVVVLRLWAASMDVVDNAIPLWYGTVSYEKITRHPLKYGGMAVTLNHMPPPTIYLTNEMDGFMIRRLSLAPRMPPESISKQQWQGGVLLIRAR
ncbi:MAG: VTT domain-containing protein [Gammaproteobacteria bacterium]|nr:VTT domain-containing protein [Gammaproteobacteria bacterium]